MSSSRWALLLLLAAALAACGGDGEGNSGTANQPPVARITASPVSGPAPLAVSVSGEASTDADGTIAGYAWTFGDGGGGSGARAEHTYANVGEFTITLTVTDDKGAAAQVTTRVVATGAVAVFNGSVFDGANYQAEPESGTFDSSVLQ